MRRTRERRDFRNRDARRTHGAKTHFRSSMLHAHNETEAAATKSETAGEPKAGAGKTWERDWEAAAQLRKYSEQNDQEG